MRSVALTAETLRRFWAKVDQSAGLWNCWPWIAATADGYGRFRFRGRLWGSHQIAYMSVHGEIPAGLKVMHDCDVRRCCNPAHLVLGTNADNMRDAAAKGRLGKRSGLKAEDVGRVAAAIQQGLSYSEAAVALGVSLKALRWFVSRNAVQVN